MKPENFEGLILRNVQESDFACGLFSLFGDDCDQDLVKSLILSRVDRSDEFEYIVAENPETHQIQALASVFIEYKFFRSGAKTAHVEKLLLSDPLNHSLFNKLLSILMTFSQSQGAYKIITSPAGPNLEESFQNSGFTVRGIHMELVLESKLS